ncbi:MAG: hypothetical protein HYY77_10325, partial [Betaproteobacteria bacterium]|nr:hypothetical protein [Betaproteobacteria bacterium]
DLPPQMLHSVSGVEFRDFIWHQGRPSSFPILMVTFIITLGFMYWYGFRKAGKRISASEAGIEAKIPDPLFATIAVGAFLLTVVGMSFREVLNVKLGFIAMTGAIMLVLIVELMGERLKAPKFEEIIQELDWRAVFFYIALFALVGGLEKTHILEMLAGALKPLFAENLALGATRRGRCTGCWCGPARWAATSRSPGRRHSMWRSASARRRKGARFRCASSCPGASRSRWQRRSCATCSGC